MCWTPLCSPTARTLLHTQRTLYRRASDRLQVEFINGERFFFDVSIFRVRWKTKNVNRFLTLRIFNGTGYDFWSKCLCSIQRKQISVRNWNYCNFRRQSGMLQHIWYKILYYTRLDAEMKTIKKYSKWKLENIDHSAQFRIVSFFFFCIKQNVLTFNSKKKLFAKFTVWIVLVTYGLLFLFFFSFFFLARHHSLTKLHGVLSTLYFFFYCERINSLWRAAIFEIDGEKKLNDTFCTTARSGNQDCVHIANVKMSKKKT